MTLAGFPHSEIFGSKLVWQLPEAYRSLLRPSSVSCVKASFTCAWVTFYDSLNLNFRLSSLIVQLTSYRYKPKVHINNCSRYAIYISRKMSFVLFLLLRLMQHIFICPFADSKEIFFYPKLLSFETHRYTHPCWYDRSWVYAIGTLPSSSCLNSSAVPS